MTASELQLEYYRATAADYDATHVGVQEPEHDFALAWLTGTGTHLGFDSFLDVGAGTGRGMLNLQQSFPKTRIVGVEPVAELRQKAHDKGIATTALIEGDACRMPFADGEFDCVLALGVMHHLPNPRAALREMFRVARRAVFISDTNSFGCGTFPQRVISHTLRALCLWRIFQFVKNGFKPWKYSPGDGIHYSYSLFDDIPFLRSLGSDCHLLTTAPCDADPLWTASHIAVLARKSP